VRQADEGWRCIKELARQLPNVQIREADKSIIFPSGGSIEFRTAEEPNRLRGSGLNLAVFDEAAYMDPEAWSVIRPALADKRGRAIFASTPNGRNWFCDVFRLGDDPLEPDWQSWSFASGTNPFIDPAELAEIRRTLPERVWLQEYEGRFLEGEGLVFRAVTRASTGKIEEPNPRMSYHAFVDLSGTGQDFTALAVFRMDRGKLVQVYADRWGGLSFEITIARIAAAAKRYRGSWALDTTGDKFDDPWIERLQDQGVRARGLRFNSQNKAAMVLAFGAALENNELTLLSPESCDAARVQLAELLSYSASRSPISGTIRYNAPPGQHDDSVVAAFTAAWMAKDEMSPEEYRYICGLFETTM